MSSNFSEFRDIDAANLKYIAATAAAFLAAYVIYRNLYSSKKSKFGRPFVSDVQRPREPLEIDRKKRDVRMRKTFSPNEVPHGLDAIIIGSGIGGLTAASILAKTGRKVLVLEQHNKAGGCCHTFVKDETEWDVGIHYVGKMQKSNFSRFVLDQLTEGQLEWAPMDDSYDRVGLQDPVTKKIEMIPIMKNVENLSSTLIKRYPEDEKAIRDFLQMYKEAQKADDYLGFLKVAPLWLCRLMVFLKWPFFPGLRKFFQFFNEMNLHDTLEAYFPNNKDLRTLLAYCWADLGTVPRYTSVGMIAAVFGHYSNGGFYPVGGSTEIPYQILPTIEKAGGKVLMNVRAKQILLSADKKTAFGVRAEYGKNKLVDIFAPIVISDAGASNTFSRLLSPEVSVRTEIGQLLKTNRLRPSCVMVQVFVGLQGSQEELELPNSNYWIFYDNTPDDLARWQNLPLSEAVKERVPLMFLGFPSAKDPEYGKRIPNRSCCIVISVVPTTWFKNWSNAPKGKRGEEYEEAKTAFGEQMWEQVLELFPQLSDRRRYMETATPVTAEFYLNAVVGESYGLDHNLERFSPDITLALRPRIPEIKNLYLSGQDVATAGFTSAMMGGLICSHAILEDTGDVKNLFGDLEKLYKQCFPDKK